MLRRGGRGQAMALRCLSLTVPHARDAVLAYVWSHGSEVRAGLLGEQNRSGEHLGASLVTALGLGWCLLLLGLPGVSLSKSEYVGKARNLAQY